MIPKENNFAYIDGANLHKGIQELGWQLDYRKFRTFLREKYGVSRAYIFLGFVPANANLYRDLQNWGYVVVFKPTLPDGVGDVKGNCDAELVLQAVSDTYELLYDSAVVVTGDGDFACLVKFLKEKMKFRVVLSPNYKKASVLLRRTAPDNMVFLDRLKNRLKYEKNSQK
ncbi:MAG: NYN domain-containing protein [Candidatus Paceibacterota bacterium]|jgi:uncharacterized LabA/DUF88 family protein|nr:NYN domain-containing protein [Candidatus Paceibacterota bacterium]